MVTIRDRKKEKGVTSGIETGVSEEQWPFAVCTDAPPFAFGKIIALCPNEETANSIATALNLIGGI